MNADAASHFVANKQKIGNYKLLLRSNWSIEQKIMKNANFFKLRRKIAEIFLNGKIK